jgi:hypothetical protein
MGMAMAAEPVTDTALAADQGTSGVREVGDKPGYGSFVRSLTVVSVGRMQ